MLNDFFYLLPITTEHRVVIVIKISLHNVYTMIDDGMQVAHTSTTSYKTFHLSQQYIIPVEEIVMIWSPEAFVAKGFARALSLIN